MTIPASLFIASAAVTGLLGSIHLLYTFHGNMLHPRDKATQLAMERSHPVITRHTTVWLATKGFNASHGLGVVLFALVFGYLAGWHSGLLQQSAFLQALGMVVLLAYVLLAWRYWFQIPLLGIALASALFAAGLAATWMELAL